MIIIYYHVAVFVSQGKTPFDESILEDAGHFTRTVMAYKGIECVDVCVRPDHVHLLLKVPAKADVFVAIETLQYWLQDFVARNSSQPPFQWNQRLWLVSKSPSDLVAVQRYFRRQSEYHASHGIEAEWFDMMDMEEIDEQ
jgi:REP element-mobilizing transposase RayT